MDFRRTRSNDAPEINLIPLIDVLLVMLIFLAATTTFMRQSAVKVVLPKAQSESIAQNTIEISIGDDGRYAIAGQSVGSIDQAELARTLRGFLQDKEDPVVVISADAMAPHQYVINAMQAAKQTGVSRIQFATQAGD